jgi:hypothetical protein
VLDSLAENKKVIDVSYSEMMKFMCNLLSVKNKDGKDVLIISLAALDFLDSNPKLQDFMTSYEICAANIPTIEKVGGGSARCLVAQVFT